MHYICTILCPQLIVILPSYSASITHKSPIFLSVWSHLPSKWSILPRYSSTKGLSRESIYIVLWACAFCIQMTPGLLGHPSSLLSMVTLILYRGCTWRTWVLQISAGICIEATAHCIRNNTRDCGLPPPFGLERLPRIFMEEHLEHPPSVHSGCPLFVFKMVPGLPSHPPSFCFVKATQEIRIAGVRVLYASNARDSGSPSFSFRKVGLILYGAAPGTPAISPSWCPLFIFKRYSGYSGFCIALLCIWNGVTVTQDFVMGSTLSNNNCLIKVSPSGPGSLRAPATCD
jgi:hypothetical protein